MVSVRTTTTKRGRKGRGRHDASGCFFLSPPRPNGSTGGSQSSRPCVRLRFTPSSLVYPTGGNQTWATYRPLPGSVRGTESQPH
ncbi:unnamed protein product [Arctogadus glacialis]